MYYSWKRFGHPKSKRNGSPWPWNRERQYIKKGLRKCLKGKVEGYNTEFIHLFTCPLPIHSSSTLSHIAITNTHLIASGSLLEKYQWFDMAIVECPNFLLLCYLSALSKLVILGILNWTLYAPSCKNNNNSKQDGHMLKISLLQNVTLFGKSYRKYH